MPMTVNRNGDAMMRFANALQSGSAPDIASAWSESLDVIKDRVLADFEELKDVRDAAVLSQRGYRQLTTAEQKWYQRIADARDSKQAFIDIFAEDDSDEIMPETIIEDVMRGITQDHPLLSKIKFQYVGYATKWIIDDSTVQKGAWGRIDAKITAEIEGSLKVIDLTQSKYSAFVVIPLAIIDLGPVWMDAYIRAVLTEAIATGVEDAIVNGTGVDMPVGLTRDPNSSFDQSNGYTEKTAVEVTSFAPAEYGALVAKLAKTEKGKPRKFQKVQLLCNMTDYLTKIMPATTTLAADGTGYVHDLFPFPTEPIVTNALADGKAVLCLLDQYTLAAGSRRNNVTEFDDSIGFLDHTRTFRNVSYFDGRAVDNTVAVVLDISDLNPAYVTVKIADTVTNETTVTGEVTVNQAAAASEDLPVA